MSTENTERQVNETAIAIRMQDLSPEYAEIMVLGKVLQASGYFRDVRDQAQAITKILWGKELGFTPIVSMSGIHIIEGKPALSSNLMATLIKRSGKYDYRVKSWTDNECSLTFRQKNGTGWEDVGESSFTLEDGKRAGVVKPGGSWSKYPKAMLFARALSQGLRTYCPDVSAAPIYNPEEMGATVDEEGAVVELPKCSMTFARALSPVEVTTEEIIIGGPGKPADAGSKGPVKATEPNGGQIAGVSATSEAEGGTRETVIPSSAPTEYITIGQQKNFHKECRAAVKPARSFDADDLTYKWLGDNGYRDKDKLPTAAMIPASGWLTIRRNAIDWLKAQ